MAVDKRIPAEVLRLLDEQGVFFLIKGEAGTGKTTFALELLKRYRDRNGVYLSTRSTSQKFFKYFPWIKGAIKPELVINVAESYEEELESEFGSFESLGVVFQFFEEFYERARKLEKPIILVDSWEGVAQRMGEKERLKTENALITLVEKANANLIFISEEPERTVLDYLADGVVVVSRRELEGKLPFHTRLIREIEVRKLKGIEIKQPNHPFTLTGGRFQYFPSFKAELPAKTVKPKPIPDTDNKVSAGSKELDDLLSGGFQKGSFNLLEIEFGVGSAYNYLILSAVINFLNQQRGVVILPTEGTTAQTYYDGVVPFTEEENFEKYTRIIQRSGVEGKVKPYVVPVPLTGLAFRETNIEWIKTIRELERKTKGAPVLGVMGIDSLEYTYGASEVEKEIGVGISLTKISNDVVLGIAKQGQALIDKLSQMSTTHFVVKNVDGAIVVYGVIPRTGIYDVSVDVSKGYNNVKLTPIV